MRITGGKEAEKIRSLLRPFGKQGRNIAEIGIGTNPKARLTGIVIEDEKVRETAHVAFGTSKSIGGKIQSEIHQDNVFLKPDISVDGKLIIKQGKFLG